MREIAGPGYPEDHTVWFLALIEATRAFEQNRYAEGVERSLSIPAVRLTDVVARHGLSGYFFRAFSTALDLGINAPQDIVAAFRRGRFAAAFFASHVEARAQDVVSILAGAGIDCILLKGAARLALRETDADLYFSSDVDLLVSVRQVEDALAALRKFGYAERESPAAMQRYAKHVHHRAPLWRAGEGTPLELHTSLSMPGTASKLLYYEELLALSFTVDTPGGRHRVLDKVGAALHLAYHGRDFCSLRDMVILSRYLRNLDSTDRARFNWHVRQELIDNIRLRSCVAVADALRGSASRADRAIVSYLSWVMTRETLSQRMRKRTRFFEAYVARSWAPYKERGHPATEMRRFILDIVAAPLVLRRGTRQMLTLRGRLTALLH